MSRVDPGIWRQHAWLNRVQSALLLSIMATFFGLLGYAIWGGAGLMLLLFLVIAGAALNPVLAPAWVMRLYGARPFARHEAPGLLAVIEELGRRAGLETMPVVYYLPSRMLNAFAIGNSRNAAIGITDGLLRQLSGRELTGVLAHEVSHIQNNDLWVMMLAEMFNRATNLLCLIGQFLLLLSLPAVLLAGVSLNWAVILLLLFAPAASVLAQLALSRVREFDADLNAARLTGDPEALASALEKIERLQGGWFERLLMPRRQHGIPTLLRTHPLTPARIERLRSLSVPQPAIRQVLPRHANHDVLVQGRTRPRRPRWHRNGLWY